MGRYRRRAAAIARLGVEGARGEGLVQRHRRGVQEGQLLLGPGGEVRRGEA